MGRRLSQSIKQMVAAALTLSIPVTAFGQETPETLNSAAAEARAAGIAEYRLSHFAEAALTDQKLQKSLKRTLSFFWNKHGASVHRWLSRFTWTMHDRF